LGGTNDYFAKHRMRPNYETEDQNFPQDTNLQGMRLHKRIRLQQFNEVILASFKHILGHVEGNVVTKYQECAKHPTNPLEKFIVFPPTEPRPLFG
jgi:hypothetical protein